MSPYVYIGIVLFTIGLFTWLFATSRIRNKQSSFVPQTPGSIRKLQAINVIGWILFIGGLLMSIIAVFF